VRSNSTSVPPLPIRRPPATDRLLFARLPRQGGPARRVWRLEAAPADDAVYDRAVYEAARVYGKRRHKYVAWRVRHVYPLHLPLRHRTLTGIPLRVPWTRSLVADNCHSHVAHALNEMAYGGRQDWNMLRVWLALMRHGRWVAPQDAFWTYLPFVCLCALVAGVSVASALTK
jgi:hypothetical protein